MDTPTLSPILTLRRLLGHWLFPMILGAFLLAGLEIILRALDFRYAPDAEFSYPAPADFAEVRYDPELFWTLNPDDPGVNARGFLGKEVQEEKPSGAYRILFIGDSIMEAGYPAQVEACLHEAGFRGVEAISLAVRGYSSYQGRVLAEKYGPLLTPDLAVVQFGWNDHWLAFGEPDAEKVFPQPPAWSLRVHRTYDRVRVLQAVGWVWGVLFKQGNNITGQMRVPAEAYRENLQEIQALFERENIPVLFVTAPSGQTQLSFSEDLIRRRFVKDMESMQVLHKAYHQITREVAGDNLVDVASMFERFTTDELRLLFQQDGIHPSHAGTEKIAAIVCESILSYLP